MSFVLHKKLVADCDRLGDLSLCRVLLMRDDRFPWLILVPRLAGLRDLHDLPRDRAVDLFDEVAAAAQTLIDQFGAEKVNVAALGNQVPQLHVHVIGRFTTDAAWPGPVWNAGPAEGVDQEVVASWAAALRPALGL